MMRKCVPCSLGPHLWGAQCANRRTRPQPWSLPGGEQRNGPSQSSLLVSFEDTGWMHLAWQTLSACDYYVLWLFFFKETRIWINSKALEQLLGKCSWVDLVCSSGRLGSLTQCAAHARVSGVRRSATCAGFMALSRSGPHPRGCLTVTQPWISHGALPDTNKLLAWEETKWESNIIICKMYSNTRVVTLKRFN